MDNQEFNLRINRAATILSIRRSLERWLVLVHKLGFGDLCTVWLAWDLARGDREAEHIDQGLRRRYLRKSTANCRF
jgi:hypothetical protein